MSCVAETAVHEKDVHENFADAVHGAGALNVEGVNFIEVDQEELNASEDVPEDIEIDVSAGSGAEDHVLSRVDAPGHPVQESPGSRRGQNFQGAGGHVMDNEGQILLEMMAPVGQGEFNDVDVTWQVTDVCRPLL